MRCAAVLALAACGRGSPIASCDDDLRGVYVAEGRRWMVLDHGATLEAYALFPDGVGDPGRSPAPGAASGSTAASPRDPDELVVAPRVIDLERTSGRSAPPGQDRPAGGLTGTLHQRFMRRAERCDANLPVHVTRCAGHTLELVLTDPSPPLGFSPCAWPTPGASRVVRWERE